ncbi:villin-1 isoform X2 [Macadamia integrifolia]|uniref:villin-1 isoform X2 n=1 Tax=Macadamia integrifolia TaxID=60698 RepID=UPI001C4F65A5|nr:villin-1 isoform X2 [Macadamia integrifolia]
MSLLTDAVDAAFQGAGANTGLEIWCVENLQLVPVPKSSHGKFFSGSTYIVLNTVLLKSGLHQHDIHYWLGNNAKEDDSALVSEKALELDAALGSHAVQYREDQGQETGKFLSYFKPCIIPIEGVFSSGVQFNSETYQVSLLACKGDHAVYVKEVPFSRSSLNHNDVFILDTASKIFLFSGCKSSTQERAKALEVVQYIIENKHNGRCDVTTIEDGKFVADPDVGEFWSLFGGYAPIARDLPSTIQKNSEIPSVYLFWISAQGQLCQIGTDSDSLKKEMLDADKCYMLDCGTELFVWMGRSTSISERKKSISSIEDILGSQGRSKGTHITFLTGGSETAAFRSYFDGWPQTVENLYEEGREKVAAIFKHHGYDVKELPDEDWQPYINCSGTLKVWRVNGSELYLIPTAEQNKLFTGDCYIVQYIYPGDEKDELLFYAWLGCNSVTEDRVEAISHMNAMVDSNKGAAVLAQVVEGEEPVQFYSIFEILIVFKGGMSSRYKCFISEKEITDETSGEEKMALFRIQESGPNSMQAVQVDPPTWQPVSVREGNEPDDFWNVLGGKVEYPRVKETKRYEEDPHLFTCTSTEGDFKVKEIYNFNQDDLTTEDVLVLDCYSEIYVWIGRHANIRSKQHALTLGMKFLEMDILVEGLSLKTPIYVVSEGYEPSFFTRFFHWDSSKARMHGNSFERKLAILKGQMQKMEAPQRSAWKANDTYSSGSYSDRSQIKTVSSDRLRRSVSPAFSSERLRRSASPAFSSDRLRRSVSPASPGSGSNFKASSNHKFSSSTPMSGELFSTASPDHDIADGSLVSVQVEEPSSMEKVSSTKVNGTEVGEGLETFPYERLKVMSNNPVTGIDLTKREAYLSHEEFQEKFGMTKKAFYELPKWRQNKHKRSLHLF